MKTAKRFRMVLSVLLAAVMLLCAGCKSAPPEPVTTEPEPTEPTEVVTTEPVDERDSAEKLLDSMTLREKVGQLFVVRPEQLAAEGSEGGVIAMTDEMRQFLDQYPVGGFAIFAQNLQSPEQIKTLNGDLKAACRIPPVITIDEEGGSVSRIANSSAFDVPRIDSVGSIGATGDVNAAYNAASDIGAYLSEYGFTMDLAPDADVNTNPNNIVIGSRAFGSDPALVSSMVSSYIDGLHAHGIMSVIKHFPGHGDTDGDTHTGYVAVHKTWEELAAVELVPFIDNFGKTDAIMVAHITADGVTSDGLPATLSKELITDRLRGELGYDGVVMTDSLEMGAISNTYSSAETAVMAFDAGNDILLMPLNLTEAFDGILAAVDDGRISEERLDESVLRILRMKQV